ncbi:hypothetical protein E1211_18855 [Micromonospora sp. 15K316]|uniref:hypothetical protein n=1 Tax=Micromonospora sp. 15K316 TaxID=2530376 RepID=UPI00104A8282|nr:hypothetical protein [Micromonospora sp. 15K316]TDC33630.1 hypothetical protein E1211_18855 [Micromonospora sp. 15K316]
MTRAPANLMAVRSLLLTHLNVDKNRVRDVDLEPAEVGIVGDPAHRGGYHCGSDRVVNNDYSVVESPRDRNGLTLDAAALDVGQFRVTSEGRTHDLRSFSTWCVGQCTAGAADTRDLREIIYSPDGRVVRRWDRLGRRSSGDDSHLWHTHFSFFRDSIKAGRDQTPLFRRYLTSIGLIAPAPPEEDEMELTDKIRRDTGNPNRTVDDVLADLSNLRNWLISPVGAGGVVGPPSANSPLTLMLAMARAYPALVAQVSGLSSKDFTDEPAIVQGVLASLTPEKIAAAIPPTMAQQVAEELARRLAD